MLKLRKNEHFTVYKNMDERFVYLADPSFGNTKVKIAKFKEMFYQRSDLRYPGKILAIIPLSEEQKRKINWDFMKVKSDTGAVYENIIDSLSRNLY